MSTRQIEQLKSDTADLKQKVVEHPLYHHISTIHDLHVFMEHHVYAVWDFMSLLKSLQISLTCVKLPWVPVGSASTRYLINEIVTGEESDVDQSGQRTSHFELYLSAMEQSGAASDGIKGFINAIRRSEPVHTTALIAGVSPSVSQFLANTFNVINTGKSYVQAAVFTFGREDLIPDMFLHLIRELNKTFPDKLGIFQYYIERHIEVDGGHHSHLACQMTGELCGDDPVKWQEATTAVRSSLEARIKLWDGVLEQIKRQMQSSLCKGKNE